jgi:aryl-alcohol dehydrogenase-like predicted oxidoreductase
LTLARRGRKIARMTTDLANSSEYRFGGELAVRRLGFGAMRITGPGIWGPPADREQAKSVLRRALELGVNLIDTADAYGPAVSEDLIAEALHPYPQGLVVATKGGLMRGGPGQWHPNGDPNYLRGALDASLKRLKLECIDLYQLHSPDAKVPFADSVGALAEQQKKGKIRYIGLSNVSVSQLAEARKVVPIVSVQNRYNLSDRASEKVLDACEKAGIGFIPWFPLATGDLAKSGGKLDTVARELGATAGQVALAWLLQRSPVMLPIPGTSTVAHLEENVAAAGIALSTDEIAELEALVAQDG